MMISDTFVKGWLSFARNAIHLARMWQSTACSLPSKTTYVLTKNSFWDLLPGL